MTIIDLNQSSDLATFLGTATEAARAAGEIARQGFHQPRQISFKGHKDIVTEADIACETAIIDIIQSRHPSHRILSEERGGVAALTEATGGDYVWIIDPIDGTHNYAAQLPFWCISVALAHEGETVVAAVYDPIHEEIFTAVKGEGAKLNGKPITVSARTDLDDSLAACDIGYDDIISPRSLKIAQEVRPFVRRVRMLGSAVLAICYVAAGRIDLFFHLHLKPWDIAAAMLIVKEADGKATDFDGKDSTIKSKEIVTANPIIHADFLALPQVSNTAHDG
ncbi:MAG: inositol monophosphatase [Candidatus Chloroheliales bacterium]|nr:MAG: inositol monophosphatase [Chloroflexota bacterium]